ncbi:DUF881 domain-containing protein [Clostridium sp. DL1XJH146]
MKKNGATIYIFVASILFGILISSNINTNKEGDSKLYLSPTEYLQAYNDRLILYKETSVLKNDIKYLEEKLEKYSEYTSDFNQVTEEMKNELVINNLILGKEDVEGPGLVITLEDGVQVYNNIQNTSEAWSRLIHDFDLRSLVNDIKNSGAEVISINGQRIIETSTILCDGPLIKVNGIKIASPFIIEVIGNQGELYNGILEDDKRLTFLRLRGIKISVDKSNDIKIFSYSGNRYIEYMSIPKEN